MKGETLLGPAKLMRLVHLQAMPASVAAETTGERRTSKAPPGFLISQHAACGDKTCRSLLLVRQAHQCSPAGRPS